MNTVTIVSFYLRNMLHQDDSYPVAVRRLARRRQPLRRTGGEEPASDSGAKRGMMVERVAREVFENLLFTGSDTPLVGEVRRALDEAFGERLTFQFRPDGGDIVIVREARQGSEELLPSEQVDALEKAWAVTLAKVDETML